MKDAFLMHTSKTAAPRLSPRILSAGLAMLATALATGTAYTRDGTAEVAFVCESGTRFSVQFHNDHVRLRNGAGVFSLGLESARTGTRYTDGNNVFWTDGETARLESPGIEQGYRCVPEGQDA